MDNDIYKAPEANLIVEEETENELATRGSRLGASIIDSLAMAVVTIPLMYFTGGFDFIKEGTEPSLEYSLVMGGAGVMIFLLFNGYLLATYGQTIGKKVLGIKIVNLDGNLPGLQSNLLPRYAVYFGLGYIPFVGSLLSMINVLFIFGSEKRCVHDYAGGTRVVKA